MPSRYWLSIPGRPEPLEVSEEELAQRRARGDLPAGTRVARLGESKWIALDELKLAPSPLRDAGEEPAPPSSSVSGVELLDQAPAFAPTIAGESAVDAGAHAPTVVGQRLPQAPGKRWGSLGRVAAIGVSAALLLSGLVGLVLWWRNGYPRGAVLEHLPDDCTTLTYVDFAAIDALPAMRGVLEKRERRLPDWAEDADTQDQFRISKDESARGRTAALRALSDAGVRPYGEVREMVRCEKRGDEGVESVRVVGGNFRGRELLRSLREAMLRRDRKSRDDKLVLDEFEGRPALALEEGHVIVMATSQVAIIGKKKLVAKLLPAKSMARTYGIADGDLIVRREEGDPPVDRRTRREGDGIVFRRLLVAKKSDEAEQKLRADLKRAGNSLRQRASLDAWADAFDGADVAREGEGARATVRWATKDAGGVLRVLADEDLRDLAKEQEAFGGVDGNDLLYFALMPGIDAFGLRVGPMSTSR